MKNSNGELSVNAQQSDPDVAAKHASSETRVSKESVGWDQLFYEGTSADELVDVLGSSRRKFDRGDFKRVGDKMNDEGMPL
ncbi:hypothetical protein [Rhizobium leguminosarum]|uniref:hypothetical protein n=1 Tax=Rhizobium leguminosarum TaxID=384 RepID=UPI001C986A1D|nr:hypothetical protein [Rhizobium leguminosarum]MBY5619931.1 hypothetical protein [Rhizobium leguminosarum]